MIIEIKFAHKKIKYSTCIDVLVSHLNYGNHLGHDALFSILHEARIRYLKKLNSSELSLAGGYIGYLITNAGASYKSEAFYGDTLRIALYLTDINKKSFVMHYEVVNNTTGKIVATAYTKHIGFDFENKKISSIPDSFLSKI